MNLILPIAGKSTRYSGMRPKWLLTLPNGDLMIEYCIRGLDLKKFDKLIIVAVEEQLIENNITVDTIYSIMSTSYDIDIEIKVLKTYTCNQVETVVEALQGKDDIPFFVKDCDNFFQFEWGGANEVAYFPLSDCFSITPGNKSYIEFNRFSELEQISEKNIISEFFCCGGYGFLSSHSFIHQSHNYNYQTNRGLYISHIIKAMIQEGDIFTANKASKYIDLGTSNEYIANIKQHQTIFCDFDGVLVINSSKFSNHPWEYKPIMSNINFLREILDNSLFSQLLITTSRPNSQKELIQQFLDSHSLRYHSVITDLPHTQRIIINDFSLTNPYPSCKAISIPRNSDSLKAYLK